MKTIDRRKLKRLVRKWLLQGKVRRHIGYKRNALHSVAEKNVLAAMEDGR